MKAKLDNAKKTIKISDQIKNWYGTLKISKTGQCPFTLLKL